jgi:WD40 repeat protein
MDALQAHRSTMTLVRLAAAILLMAAGSASFGEQFSVDYGPTFAGDPSWRGASAVAVSPDGTALAGGYGDGIIRLWGLQSRRLLREFTGLRGWVGSVAFSPDGSALAAGDAVGNLLVWEVATGRGLLARPDVRIPVKSVAFSPDGRTLAYVQGREVRMIRTRWGVDTSSWSLPQHLHDVDALAFSPNGKTLATTHMIVTPAGDGDFSAVLLWDPKTGALRARAEVFQGTAPALAFSVGGDLLAVGMIGGPIHLLDGRDARRLRRLELPNSGRQLYAVGFSPDGQQFGGLVAGVADEVLFYQLTNGAVITQVQTLTRAAARALSFTRDARTLAVACQDGTIATLALVRTE